MPLLRALFLEEGLARRTSGRCVGDGSVGVRAPYGNDDGVSDDGVSDVGVVAVAAVVVSSPASPKLQRRVLVVTMTCGR